MTVWIIEERLDHLEEEVARRKMEHKAITARLDRRRHWWIAMGLTGIAMAGTAMIGSYMTARGVVDEARAREAQVCAQRNEVRSGNREEIEALLPLMPADSPAALVLRRLRDTTFAPVDC